MKSNNLALINLRVMRDGIPVLPPISREIGAGEIMMVHAPNGYGKSSFLKCLAGLLRADLQSILLDGEPLHRHPEYPRNLVYLGHKRGVEPSLSVFQHVSFWARAYGQPELIDAALHYFDLEDIAETPVHQLSAGWQQRVALTRLITQPGSIWLLDEPTSHLDEDGLSLLHSIIQTRSEQGGMIIIASHALLQGEKVTQLNLAELSKTKAMAA